MHILGIIVAFLGAAAFWWYRVKIIRDAGSEVIDAAGRMKGKYRRNKIRTANEQSPITAIDDPITSAATLVYMMLENAETTPAQDNFVRGQFDGFSDEVTVDEAVVYGRWAAQQGIEKRKAIKMLCKQLNGWLDLSEKLDIEKIISTVSQSDLFNVSETSVQSALTRLGLVE
ncbi:hypothetical protein ACFQ14_10420 [Pseudahrensia aquimaris]|uniref:Co-chaperone DjlA N-terminal domain-containing protein n=1 Tax=Pseudahrensia aquimaris TaxID=744461 RepID=A0ABW3FGS7_9HYPH